VTDTRDYLATLAAEDFSVMEFQLTRDAILIKRDCRN
jgi:hypothetical protein